MSRTRSTTAIHLLAVLGVGTAILLSGCSLLPNVPTLGGGSSSDESSDESLSDGGNSTDEGSLEEEIEENPFLDNTIPDTFPDIPVPDLEVLLGLDLGIGWSVVFKADDPIDDFNDLADQFESAGWEQLARTTNDDQGFAVYNDDEFQVQISSAVDTGDYDSPIVTMTVARQG